MRDKFKLEALFQAFGVPYRWDTRYALVQGDRTFKFDEKGDIIKVEVK